MDEFKDVSLLLLDQRILRCSLFVLLLGGTVQAEDLIVYQLPDAVVDETRMLNGTYLATIPDAATEDSKLPILIFLHGAGGRGREIERVERIARPALMGMQRFAGEPCIFVAPQATQGTKEVPASWLPEDLDQFLAHLKSTLPVDETRVYLTGNSMGGYGTWAWAAHSPQHFAAVAPVVGGLGKGGPKDITPNLDTWAESLAKIPVWAFHGAQDKVVPADRSERIIKLIRGKGGEVAKLTLYPKEGHGASRLVYTSRDFYDWLFDQTASGRTSDVTVDLDQD